MSHLIIKAKKTIKKKAGDMLDRLRPPSRQSRSTSPDPSAQDVPPANIEIELNPSSDIAVVIQTPIPPTQVSNASLHPAGPATTVSQPSADSAAPTSAIAHEEAPSAPTILATTGLAVKGLLVAARDGSDLFLPLKAALVGVVALWDICDVSGSLYILHVAADAVCSALPKPKLSSRNLRASSKQSTPSPPHTATRPIKLCKSASGQS